MKREGEEQGRNAEVEDETMKKTLNNPRIILLLHGEDVPCFKSVCKYVWVFQLQKCESKCKFEKATDH